MASPSAVFLALDLVRNPILAGVLRQRQLPDDVLFLIQVAAGSPEAMKAAEDATGKGRNELRRAAAFYIQQVMWPRGSDYYRALGVSPAAPQPKLAEHLRWLMKWLHPDRGDSELNKLYAARVLKAWENLKTADRRRTYDRSLALEHVARRQREGRRYGRTKVPLLPRVTAKSGPRAGSRSMAGSKGVVATAMTLVLATFARISGLLR